MSKHGTVCNTTQDLLEQKLPPSSQEMPSLMYTSYCQGQNEERERECVCIEYTAYFIMLHWSSHLMAIISTILESKECNPYSFKYCYVKLTIQFDISHLFAHRWDPN